MEGVDKISKFLQCNHDEGFLKKVVDMTSFESMKQREKQEHAESNIPGLWIKGQEGFVRTGINSFFLCFACSFNYNFFCLVTR